MIRPSADIRMCSHRLLRLSDNKSAAGCQQAWCKLIVKTFYPQAWCKLFQQLVTSRQISSCNKSDFHRLAASWWIQQTCCNLLTTCIKPVKSATCRNSVAFLVVQQLAAVIFQKENSHISTKNRDIKPIYFRYAVTERTNQSDPLMFRTRNPMYAEPLAEPVRGSHVNDYWTSKYMFGQIVGFFSVLGVFLGF